MLWHKLQGKVEWQKELKWMYTSGLGRLNNHNDMTLGGSRPVHASRLTCHACSHFSIIMGMHQPIQCGSLAWWISATPLHWDMCR